MSLGATREEIRARYGQPELLHTRGGYFPTSQYASVARVYGLPQDVYTLHTSKSEYEVKVTYGLDTRISRLHPTIRTSLIEFTPDKPLTTEEALKDLAVLHPLCQAGCTVRGDANDIVPSITALQSDADENARTIASYAASNWREESDTRYVPAIRIWLQSDSFKRRGLTGARVDKIHVTVEQPEGGYSSAPILLGTMRGGIITPLPVEKAE